MYLFLTDTCIGIIKNSGVRKFCPNSKFTDKTSAGLTRFDCSLFIYLKFGFSYLDNIINDMNRKLV